MDAPKDATYKRHFCTPKCAYSCAKSAEMFNRWIKHALLQSYNPVHEPPRIHISAGYQDQTVSCLTRFIYWFTLTLFFFSHYLLIELSLL